MQRNGVIFRKSKASINFSIRPWKRLHNTTKADLIYTPVADFD